MCYPCIVDDFRPANTAQVFSLDVIYACVLDGVSLKRGVAPIQGAIVGF
ncbi:MAG: hypothetical protein KAV87_35400 [Desulfobacteraceae bacterium]|nr:hypothetical protein [Desulfobacteraceae bacterium]